MAANYEITYADGMLTVVKKKGDVNGDGDVDQKVNVADIVLLVKMIEK